MRTHVLVLNYNGRDLLSQCLPSLVEAARNAPGSCPITVVDNDSTDDSLAYLAEVWPGINVIREPNRGLASFNFVLKRMNEQTVLLLNNDVKLDPYAIQPLLDALEVHNDALFAAPLCWTFDGSVYEGMRTLVRTRFGLIQGLARVPGFESAIHREGLTASAGPILMVDREKFLFLGGYDPVYFPGRIEDLDLGFRGWMAGFTGRYVPQSLAYHKGFGSFEPAFGRSGCDDLALRNSMIFAWKNLAGGKLIEHLAWLPVRALYAFGGRRWGFFRALLGAFKRLGDVRQKRRSLHENNPGWAERQEAFFREFAW